MALQRNKYSKPGDIDAEEVFKLAQLGCRTEEISDFFGVSKDSVERLFAAELQKGRASLKVSLRRAQLQSVANGNVAMMIWLGKQLLGQLDKFELLLTTISDDELAAEAKRRIEFAKKTLSNS